ncbi:hypothetical protein [Haloarcula marina]|uniref:hypothetical protein n=1 Tax=Haloarcula marina TaxID=2961574 RepID=UPI0020B69C36|nr:hypothetical protein [Halomicroarcula marina]
MEEREFKYRGAANLDETNGVVDPGWDEDETFEAVVQELYDEGEISDRARDELLDWWD